MSTTAKKTLMDYVNPLLARARKVLRIVEVAVSLLLVDGPPTAKPAFALGLARNWDEGAWRRVALIAGQKPPSAETRREVLASLERMMVLS